MIRVSKKGQATIPKDLRERFGIETPGKVLIREEGGKIVVEPLPSVEDREEGGKIVVEPLPSVEEMQGVHAGRYERGEVLDRLRGMNEKDKRLERERNERLDRGR